jgi:DNA polymerase III delta prime subunit
MRPNYIGKTERIAEMLWRQIPKLKTSPDPLERRYLFTGTPGTGKTDLAEHLAAALTGEKVELIRARMALNVQLLNGQSCSIEVVRQWQNEGQHRPMFGECRVILVDEIDAISPAALNEIRSFLDRLPSQTVFIATTNKQPSELQEQLNSRFKLCYFEPIADATLYRWLVDELKVAAYYAEEIIKGAKGNVRAAKLDALAWLESQ